MRHVDWTAIAEPSAWTNTLEGYFLMFVAMFLGGPAVTSAAAFAAAFGVFNVWLVFLVSIISNIVPDYIWYALGYWGREQLVKRLFGTFGKYFKTDVRKMEAMEKLFHDHVGKTMIFVKLVPFIATPGLIAAGAAKVPIKKFTFWAFIVTLPTSGIFLLLGYYFGAAVEKIIRYTEYGGLLALGLVISFFVISHFYRKFTKRMATTLEEMEEKEEEEIEEEKGMGSPS